MKHAPGFLALVESVMPSIREVTVPEVRRMLQEGARFALIDVREDHEWEQGHIEGAVHLGRGIIERDIEQEVPDKDAPIVLYCGGGYRSALAAFNLQRMGYRDVRSMAGGWRGWNETV